MGDHRLPAGGLLPAVGQQSPPWAQGGKACLRRAALGSKVTLLGLGMEPPEQGP